MMRRLFVPFVLIFSVLSACSSAPPSADPATETIVVGEGYEWEALNPLLGFGGEGASKLFDGLIKHDAALTVVPALAAEVPAVASDGRSWTVKLRQGVSFHDGSAFDADDVVATYRAVLDPVFAATVSSDFPMLTSVEKVDALTVRFELEYPYAPFANRLNLGIMPSEALATPAALESSSFNSAPIGTGPYKLAEWRRGATMTLVANEDYFDGAPQVKKITIVFAEDDNTRAQQMRAGDLDATVLPPALARTFEGGEFAVVHHRSADYRTVTLPSSHPVTGDPAIRKALNLAVNRQGMIDALLAGRGVPASTPVPAVLDSYVEPAAQFQYDPAEADRILDDAGWVLGADGIRTRNGQPARFTLMYPTTDTVRKDLAQAVVSDAKAVGVEVVLEGLGWEAIEPRLTEDALVMGGGSQLDPDQVIYPLLHSSFGGDGFNNPGYYRNAEVDAGLEAARRATDPAEQIAAVKSWQRAYAADPGFVFLVFLDHSYVMRQKWDGYTPVVDPHSHGVLTWGALWNFEDWTPKR